MGRKLSFGAKKEIWMFRGSVPRTTSIRSRRSVNEQRERERERWCGFNIALLLKFSGFLLLICLTGLSLWMLLIPSLLHPMQNSFIMIVLDYNWQRSQVVGYSVSSLQYYCKVYSVMRAGKNIKMFKRCWSTITANHNKHRSTRITESLKCPLADVHRIRTSFSTQVLKGCLRVSTCLLLSMTDLNFLLVTSLDT